MPSRALWFVFLVCVVASAPANALSVDLRGVTFEAGKPVKGESLADALSSEELGVLETSIEILKDYPDLLFKVTGHVDPDECAGGACEELSLRRAVLVYRYLIDAGIDARRVVQLEGYSYTRMLGTWPGERSFNRRADIQVALEP